VDHLLTHTAGGWQNDSTDPMFEHNDWDHDKLIAWAIKELPLTSPPGEHWAYSNFGYCVLGRVIEQVTGQPYTDYVTSSILSRSGISDMRIGGNKLRDRVPEEVVYSGQFGEDPYKMNVTRMDSHGGWIATAADLVRFLDAITGAGDTTALLKHGTIRTMTTPSPASDQSSDVRYAGGWNVRDNGLGNWWHNGSLPGTAAIMVRTESGLSWAALTNTRSQPSDEINSALDRIVWNMVRAVPAWNA
jgi:CubicO group peptidase (beta-lactamase class C family)